MFTLTIDDLAAYARGCAILGTGGGGDVDVPLLQARAALETHGPVEVVAPEEVASDALIAPVGGWGAPTVGIERFESGDEMDVLARAVEQRVGRRIDVVMPGEIGGGNGVTPVAYAAQSGLPLLDADGMGRAFPRGDQVAMHVAGIDPAPAFLVDHFGNVVILEPTDTAWLERLARSAIVAFGGTAMGVDHLMDGDTARGGVVPGTVSQALALGRALDAGGLDALIEAAGAIRLMSGKVVDVDRRTTGGFARGEVTIEGTGGDTGRTMRVRVQNENLVAIEEPGEVVASVPDLIVIVDEATGDAIATERVRFGHRVVVIAMPCAPVWRTEEGLRLAGPSAFGYPHAYEPIEERGRG